jgi:alpha-glucosidase
MRVFGLLRSRSEAIPYRFVATSLVFVACSSGSGQKTGSDGNLTPDACPQAEGLIHYRIARFAPVGVPCESLSPSLALVEPLPAIGDIPADWRAKPQLRRDGERHVAALEIGAGTSLYGTGEIAGPLLRNGKVTEAWAEQTLGFDDTNDRLYQAHPWVLAVRADGSSFGVFADTTHRVRIDLRDGIVFSAEVPFTAIVIEGASPQEVLGTLAKVTGPMELPPLWSLGYHQSRFSYTPDSRVREIASELRQRSLPSDVIWMDIDYMDRFRVFTFDPVDFPDPQALNNDLHESGFKAVWMIDPCVATDPGYSVYDEGTAGDHWITEPSGAPFVGKVWPGPCVFPDYTRAETRDWWASLYGDFLATGIDGVWNDMNEPSQITPPYNPPNDLLHRGDGELPAGTHAQYHNAYGMLMTRASREGMLRAQPNKRPFLLTRSTFLGGQRYAATWTGDNSSTWPHLRWSVTMVLNLGLSGQPFSGPDIGGFLQDPDARLFSHWMGVGAFFPFSRGHAALTSSAQEPWAFGAEVEATSRTALERRYRLLPYIYTVFREAAELGLPVVRPLFFLDPADPALRSEDHAFLLGGDVLILPQLNDLSEDMPEDVPKDVTEAEAHEFPKLKGVWRELNLVGEDPNIDVAQPVVKVRPGAIVPLGRVVQNTTQPLLEPLTLVVSLNEDGLAAGTLYEDAGDGFGYRDGDFSLTTYRAEREGARVVVRVSDVGGQRARESRVVQVELLTGQGTLRASGDPSEGIVIDVP